MLDETGVNQCLQYEHSSQYSCERMPWHKIMVHPIYAIGGSVRKYEASEPLPQISENKKRSESPVPKNILHQYGASHCDELLNDCESDVHVHVHVSRLISPRRNPISSRDLSDVALHSAYNHLYKPISRSHKDHSDQFRHPLHYHAPGSFKHRQDEFGLWKEAQSVMDSRSKEIDQCLEQDRQRTAAMKLIR